jgi:hypothetical protein
MKNIVASATEISAIYYDLDARLLRIEYRNDGGSIEEHSTLPEFKEFVRIVENLVEDADVSSFASGSSVFSGTKVAIPDDPFSHILPERNDALTESASDEIDRVLFAASRRSRTDM